MEMEDKSFRVVFVLMCQIFMGNVHNIWLVGIFDIYENSGVIRKYHYDLGKSGILKSSTLNLSYSHPLGRPGGKFSAFTAGTHGSCGLLSIYFRYLPRWVSKT